MSFPDPDLDFFTHPGCIGQKGTGSRIRIRNTVFLKTYRTRKSKPRLDHSARCNIKNSTIPGIIQLSMASITRTLGNQIKVNRRLTKSGFKPPRPLYTQILISPEKTNRVQGDPGILYKSRNYTVGEYICIN
jgi:hypothetical protein